MLYGLGVMEIYECMFIMLLFIYYMFCLFLYGFVRLMYLNLLWIIKKKGFFFEYENRNLKYV